MDSWFREQRGQRFDHNGTWAASGSVLPELLDKMLADPFFSRPAPKSTGREHFNLQWLYSITGNTRAAPADIQATLAELSAASMAAAIRSCMARGNVWLCGGGAQNNYLVQRIIDHLPGCNVASTAVLGIAPEWVEAVAFAWLARARLHGEAAGIPSVTGARARAVLGSVHLPPET
jgi:anhydro-N-acetylmuramic acid kinase